MFMFCFFLQSGWNTAVAEQDVWNMLKVNLPLRFVLFFGEAPSRRMGALGEKKDRKNDRLIEGYKPPGNEWLSRDESSIRFPVVMFFKNNITLLACVQPQLGCNCTRATLYDLNQREAVNRKNLTAYRTKMKLHCREGSVVFLILKKVKSQRRRRKIKRFLWAIRTKRSLVTWCLVSWLGYKTPKLGHEGELTLQHLRYLRHLSHVTNP